MAHTKQTNNDAVVDCIVYANERRVADSDQPYKQPTRAILGNVDKECSITMCGMQSDDTRTLVFCENGHCMHDVCIENIVEHASDLNLLRCPQCRSDDALQWVMEAMPISYQEYIQIVSSTHRGLKTIIGHILSSDIVV